INKLKQLRGGGLGLYDPPKPERVGFPTHGFDAESDVFFKWDTEFFRAFDHVLPVYSPREGFVLHAILYRTCFQIQNAFRWTNVRARSDEARKFITRKKRFFERGIARHASVVRMGKNRANNFFRIAFLPQDLGAFRRMAAVGCVLMIGPALVVKIVQEGGDAPVVFVRASLESIGTDARFNGEHMFAQGIRLRVFTEQRPSFFTSGHQGDSDLRKRVNHWSTRKLKGERADWISMETEEASGKTSYHNCGLVGEKALAVVESPAPRRKGAQT